MRIDEITLRSLSSCSPGFELPKSKESGEMAKASNIILVQGAWASDRRRAKACRHFRAKNRLETGHICDVRRGDVGANHSRRIHCNFNCATRVHGGDGIECD
jgi:hypothetical protein